MYPSYFDCMQKVDTIRLSVRHKLGRNSNHLFTVHQHGIQMALVIVFIVQALVMPIVVIVQVEKQHGISHGMTNIMA